MDLKYSSNRTKSGVSSQYLVPHDASVSLFETYEPNLDHEAFSTNSVNSTEKKGFYLEDTLRDCPVKISYQNLSQSKVYPAPEPRHSKISRLDIPSLLVPSN